MLDLRHPFRIAIGLGLLLQSFTRTYALVSSFYPSGQCFAADFLHTQCRHLAACSLRQYACRYQTALVGTCLVRLCLCRANQNTSRAQNTAYILTKHHSVETYSTKIRTLWSYTKVFLLSHYILQFSIDL